MTRFDWIRLFFISAIACVCSGGSQAEPTFYTPSEDLDGLDATGEVVEGLPRVLLIGDSISIGYTKPVIARLEGIANVQRAPENCGDTRRGLERLDAWLGDGSWDVIHFNWGLWDLCYREEGSMRRDKVSGVQAIPLAQYEKNLEQLVRRLKETGAILIWASTTVVPEGEVGRHAEDVLRYNQAAALVMKRHGVEVDDLYPVSLTLTSQMKEPGNVHFTKEGSASLAEVVAQSIQESIKKKIDQ